MTNSKLNTQTPPAQPVRLIRKKEVSRLTGLSESSIYDYMRNGLFPKSVSLGGRSVAWVESEVISFIESRIAQRNEVA